MSKIKVVVETSRKKTFAVAIDWPGWARSGKDEESALQNLLAYGARYAHVLQQSGIDFQPPEQAADFSVIQQVEGNATTAFGAPAVIVNPDSEQLTETEYQQYYAILQASWASYDQAVQNAGGRELRKGPRGGGRDVDKIHNHIIEADRSYLARIAWKHKREEDVPLTEELLRVRQSVEEALAQANQHGLPEKGPRGGLIWPLRFFFRRIIWHTLDHAWEIEDRIM